jgi:heme/copper-type cytochrome/quinol oxidase subunit 2
MSNEETGIYSFNYTTTSEMTGGVWEAVASATVNGVTVKPSDFWELASSPAQVKINSIIDKTIPSITANVTITNEGSSEYEYHYEYCIVAEESNICGGGDDLAYVSASKLLNASESWNTLLTLDGITRTGTLWFKVIVYYGTERSGASQTFVATSGQVTPTPTPSGGVTTGKVITGPTQGVLQVIDYPENIKVFQGETIEKEIKVKNTGSSALHNVEVLIEGLPLEIYSITPKKIDILAKDIQTFKIIFSANNESKQYFFKFKINSDEAKEELASVLSVEEKPAEKPIKPEISEKGISSYVLYLIIGIIVLIIIILLVYYFRRKSDYGYTGRSYRYSYRGMSIAPFVKKSLWVVFLIVVVAAILIGLIYLIKLISSLSISVSGFNENYITWTMLLIIIILLIYLINKTSRNNSYGGYKPVKYDYKPKPSTPAEFNKKELKNEVRNEVYNVVKEARLWEPQSEKQTYKDEKEKKIQRGEIIKKLKDKYK